SFTYRAVNAQHASPLATVTIHVTEAQDVAISGFYSDGTNLLVSYLVVGPSVAPFKIAVYASGDGVSLDAPLQEIDADYSQGFHTLPIYATFDDPQDDYYLVAHLDSADDVNEINEDNNTAVFAGGAFIDHEAMSGQTVLQVHGTDGADPISVAYT